jgi:hypothetical protein
MKMVKKLVVLAVIFAVLCLGGVGCYRGEVRGGVGDSPYYDGPYGIGGGSYYYYNGGFYTHDGGTFRFHHDVPRNERGYYEENHRKNREQYHSNYHNWQNQHPGHPWASKREEDKRK